MERDGIDRGTDRQTDRQLKRDTDGEGWIGRQEGREMHW